MSAAPDMLVSGSQVYVSVAVALAVIVAMLGLMARIITAVVRDHMTRLERKLTQIEEAHRLCEVSLARDYQTQAEAAKMFEDLWGAINALRREIGDLRDRLIRMEERVCPRSALRGSGIGGVA